MSYEIGVEGGSTITQATWCARTERLGATLRFADDFDLVCANGPVRAELTIPADSELPSAKSLRGGGPYEVTVDIVFQGLWVDADEDLVGRRCRWVRRQIEEFESLGLPDVLVDMARDELASLCGSRDLEARRAQRREELLARVGRVLDFEAANIERELKSIDEGTWSPRTPTVRFASSGGGAPDVLAAVAAAAGLASATGGRLHEHQRRTRHDAADVARVFPEVLERAGFSPEDYGAALRASGPDSSAEGERTGR